MTIKIHRILKSDLSHEGEMNASLAGLYSNTSGMTISHYAYSSKQTQATIPYTLEIASEYVPTVDVDFCVVIRTKVDLTATGPNEKTINDVGNDIGEYNYLDSVPSKPNDLPPGFTELYKG